MVDDEAAFFNAIVDTNAYIRMPDRLKNILENLDKSVWNFVIKLMRAQYGLVQNPRH